MVNMFPAWRTELLVLGVYFEEGLDSYVLGGCEMNSWRLKMKTQCVFHLQAGIQSSHMLNVLTIQEVILTRKHVLLTHLSPTLPWEEPSTVSHRESVLYCFPTDGSTTSSCLGHSAIIKTSTRSRFSCYCTCESIHWYIHVHAYTHTLTGTHWLEMTRLTILLLIFFWQLVANVTSVGFIFHCWGIFCVTIEPSCQMKRVDSLPIY